MKFRPPTGALLFQLPARLRRSTFWLVAIAFVTPLDGLQGAAPQAQPAAEADSQEGEEAEGEKQKERPSHHAFKLGDFNVKDYRPVEHEKVKLQFTVYVEVVDGKQGLFEKMWENHEHRIRSQVITAARLVPSLEYDDPTLRAFRRRIYLRLKRNLPDLPVDQVFITDFSYTVR